MSERCVRDDPHYGDRCACDACLQERRVQEAIVASGYLDELREKTAKELQPEASLGRLAVRSISIYADPHTDSRDLMYWRYRVEMHVTPVGDYLPPPGAMEPPALVYSQIQVLKRLPPEAMRQAIRAGVIEALTHEIDEWLKVDGVQVTDPHPERKLDRWLEVTKPKGMTERELDAWEKTR